MTIALRSRVIRFSSARSSPSVQIGKLADLVLWKPSLFGAKPEIVFKGGFVAWAQIGDPNASIPTPEPVEMRPMFAGKGMGASACSVAFVSSSSLAERGPVSGYGLKKRWAVHRTRILDRSKASTMRHTSVRLESHPLLGLSRHRAATVPSDSWSDFQNLHPHPPGGSPQVTFAAETVIATLNTRD